MALTCILGRKLQPAATLVIMSNTNQFLVFVEQLFLDLLKTLKSNVDCSCLSPSYNFSDIMTAFMIHFIKIYFMQEALAFIDRTRFEKFLSLP